MTLTVDILRAWFRQFNADYFGGELPVPRLALSKARTRLGTMSYKRKLHICVVEYSDFTIRVSTYYDCTEREYQETLLHEMIHYYIAYKRIRDKSSHGPVFRQMMRQLNEVYGWNVTVSSSMRDHKLSDPQSARAVRPYVVLAIVTRNGGRMLSVVNPRSAREIDRRARMAAEIVDHRWYMTQDEYFREFPKVRSLRARRVTSDVYNEKTAAMQPLTIKDNPVFRMI